MQDQNTPAEQARYRLARLLQDDPKRTSVLEREAMLAEILEQSAAPQPSLAQRLRHWLSAKPLRWGLAPGALAAGALMLVLTVMPESGSEFTAKGVQTTPETPTHFDILCDGQPSARCHPGQVLSFRLPYGTEKPRYLAIVGRDPQGGSTW